MSHRRAARVDANQREIVKGLEARGCSVQSLAAAGGGVPDLLVGLRGCNYLLEVKRPETRSRKPRAIGGTSTDTYSRQERWRQRWGGQAAVVHDLAEALEAVGIRT